MIIRHARPEDNEQLLAIEHHSPQGRALKLLSERKNYFVRADRFSEHILMVAEDENSGNILGIMGVGIVKVMLGGKAVNAGLVFDWRSNSQAASGLTRHMMRLWQGVFAEAKAHRLDFMFGYIKEDNVRSLGIILRSGPTVAEDRDFLTIPVHRAFARHLDENQPTVEHQIDAVESLAGLHTACRGRDLLPLAENPELMQHLHDAYLRARISVRGSSVKIWDSTADYTHRVVSTPWYYQATRPVFKAVSHVLPLPHVPRPGEEIREWFLYDFLIEQPEDLPVLLEKARRLATESRVDYLITCLSKQEAV